MNLFLLKLILAPIILGSASLAGRRWGSAISGWLVGLPLTSGPAIFILALSHDLTFVVNAIRGTLSGGFSLIAYTLVYAWISRKYDWRVAIGGSIFIFAAMTMILQNVVISFIPLFFFIILTIFLGLWLMPKSEPIYEGISTPGHWDIPARILVGTSFLLLITWIASYVGPQLTGLLTTIPLYTSILTIFAHREQGHAGANGVLRGLIFGLFAFAGFYLVLGLLIERASIAVSFGAATLASLGVQGLTLLILKPTRTSS
jgi:hypothetical protein